MTKAEALVAVACVVVFMLIVDTHTAEKKKAHHFAGVIAACANGRDFLIGGRIVHCIPVDTQQQP